ncbi:restriction endonuclease subunit S [Gemmatimonadota bacterium]
MSSPGSAAWPAVKLEALCRRITVGHVGPMANEYVESGVPFLRSQNVQPFRISDQNLKYIGPEFHDKLVKSSLSPGDVVVVRTGYPGTACVIPVSIPECNCADLVIIRPGEDLNPYFLAAFFNSAIGRARVGGSLVGVAQQHFNITAARNLMVQFPSRVEQDRIASILSAYDDLIENNLRRIQVLEEMAQALYREWFVEFRFPGHGGVVTKDSDLGPIPEDWSLATLGDLSSMMRSGSTPKRKEPLYWQDGVYPWYKTKELHDHHLFDAEEMISELAIAKGARLFDPGTILMAIYGSPTVGRLGILTRRASCNQAALAMVPQVKLVTASFLFHLLWSKRKYFNSIAQGAAQQNISKQKVQDTVCVLPDRGLIEEFDSLCSPTLGLRRALEDQVRNLRRQRDLLLPRLISGELDVSELDIDVVEAA